MALVRCTECGNAVSSSASACPKCGAPVGGGHAIGTPLSTIQQTSKRLKLHIIGSSLLFWGGLIWALAVANQNTKSNDPSGSAMFAVILLIIGFFWYLATKFRIWWHHK